MVNETIIAKTPAAFTAATMFELLWIMAAFAVVWFLWELWEGWDAKRKWYGMFSELPANRPIARAARLESERWDERRIVIQSFLGAWWMFRWAALIIITASMIRLLFAV